MIYIYTLVNGEQIIGEEQLSNSNEIMIENPFYIMETQDEYGNNAIKLINVCTFSDQQYIVVYNKHIVYHLPANDSMSQYYHKLIEVSKKSDTYKMMEESVKQMDEMEKTMRDVISKRLIDKSTIN